MGILKVYLRWGNRLSPVRKSPLKKTGVRMLEQHIRDAKLNSIKPENLALICWRE